MKPAPFEYHAPASLEEALALLDEHGSAAKPLAGGQSLVPAMNFRLAQPEILVDLNRIASLAGIRESPGGGLLIGAMTRQRALEREPSVAARAPLLVETLPHVAHAQIRNRGTLGGNLAHADPASELPAVAIALEARCRSVSRRGERWIKAEEFFTGLFATALLPGELLVEIEIPPPPPGAGWAFEEVARRHGDYALAGVAVRVELDAGGRCRGARAVLLGVGEGPTRAAGAERGLEGEVPTEAVVRAAAEAAAAALDPPGDIHASPAYRRHLAGVLVRRALTRAAARARGSR